jgi:hypothetical protein
LGAVQTLGPASSAAETVSGDDAFAPVAPELAQQAAERIKAAADIGDVMQVAAIASELKSENDALTPFCDKVIQMSEDFDLDGIAQLADELNRQKP